MAKSKLKPNAKKSLEKKKANSVFISEFVFFSCGGDNRTRTYDLYHVKVAL